MKKHVLLSVAMSCLAMSLVSCGEKAHVHDLVHVAAVSATCTETGIVEHYHCEECSKNFADQEAKTEIENIIIAALGHNLTFVNTVTGIDCEHKGTIAHYHCERCGKNFLDENATQELSSLEGDYGAHSLIHHPAVAGVDCLHKGTIEYWECEVCSKKYSDAQATNEITSIEGEYGAHDLVHHAAVPGADCLHKGTIEYWECSVCSKKFADAKATTEITSIEGPYGEHNLTLVPSDTTIDTYYCDVCSKYLTESGKEIDLTNRIPNDTTFEPTTRSVEVPAGVNVHIAGAETYVNWSPTPSHIVLEEDGNVAYRVDQIVWGQYSHFMKDISFDCLAIGTYEFKFDVKVSEVAKTAVNPSNVSSFIESRVKLGGSHIYQLPTVSTSALSTTEYTTITAEFTNTEAIVTDWAQVEINYWAEGSITDNYILLDNFKIIVKGDETDTNIDRRENTYYDCNEDRFLIETLPKKSGLWKHRFVNFDDTDTYIVTGKGNNWGIIQQQVWGQSSVLLFDIGPNFLSAGEYTLSFDVRPSYTAATATNPSGVSSFAAPHIGTISGWQKFEDIHFGGFNPNVFTRVDIDFTATYPNPDSWVQAAFWYWAEGSLDANFIEIDNIQITRKGETTPLGNDREYNGGFDFFTNGPSFPKPGFYEGGFGTEPGTIAQIIKEENGNHALKIGGDVDDLAFNFSVGAGVLEAEKSYMLTMRIKLSDGCLDLGTVGMTTFAENGRYLDASGNPLVVELVSAENELSPEDGWVILSAEFTTGEFAAVGWCNLYFYAVINNSETKDTNNYLLVDDFNVFALYP